MKAYYIFTEAEPIKIEFDKHGMMRIENKWIKVKSFEEQILKFLERINKNEHSNG